MHKSVTPAQLDPEARYILSGLGRSIVRYMSDRGARDVVLWSRSGSDNLSPEAKSLIEDLATKRVCVQAVTYDVSNREQVMRAMQHASSDRTVRGVLNYAVSYQDIPFEKLMPDMFHEVMAAKVLGTKTLHEATLSLPLEFFAMVSTTGTIHTFPTQNTYLVANNSLDYSARYRRQCGLPVSTVPLGFISDLGALTQDAVTVNLIARTKCQIVTGAQVLRMLEPAFVVHSKRHDAHQHGLAVSKIFSQTPTSLRPWTQPSSPS
jgi:hypothetical protein